MRVLYLFIFLCIALDTQIVSANTKCTLKTERKKTVLGYWRGEGILALGLGHLAFLPCGVSLQV